MRGIAPQLPKSFDYCGPYHTFRPDHWRIYIVTAESGKTLRTIKSPGQVDDAWDNVMSTARVAPATDVRRKKSPAKWKPWQPTTPPAGRSPNRPPGRMDANAGCRKMKGGPKRRTRRGTGFQPARKVGQAPAPETSLLAGKKAVPLVETLSTEPTKHPR